MFYFINFLLPFANSDNKNTTIIIIAISAIIADIKINTKNNAIEIITAINILFNNGILELSFRNAAMPAIKAIKKNIVVIKLIK